ncbi:MAG: hypothetical protein LBE78_04590 [Burkholderiaceae bacterium]|jgi:hypothetical protein|nr:hypothetical protein [Burkholderiaceae bacterium]
MAIPLGSFNANQRAIVAERNKASGANGLEKNRAPIWNTGAVIGFYRGETVS